MTALIILTFAIANALRGEGAVSRLTSAFIMAIALAFVLFPSPLIQLLTIALLMLGLSFGWGKYFMAATGEDKRHEKEFPPADWVLDRLNIKNNYLYGIVGMAIRWAVGFAPLLLFAHQNVMQAILYAVALGVAAGCSYYLAGLACRMTGMQRWAIRLGELIAGGWLAWFLL